MNFVELPSGITVNLDQVTYTTTYGEDKRLVVFFAAGTNQGFMQLDLRDAEAAALTAALKAAPKG